MDKEDKKSIAVNFRQNLEKFRENVDELAHNSSLSTRKDFLEKVAEDVHRLYASSIQVQKEEDEEIEEIGSIIQNIFIQPLSIKEHHQVTLLKAVEAFDKGKEAESDLSYIMREYVKHPESTKSFIRELELLTDDLNSALKKIA